MAPEADVAGPRSHDDWVDVLRRWRPDNPIQGSAPRPGCTYIDNVYGEVALGNFVCKRKREARGQRGCAGAQEAARKLMPRIQQVSWPTLRLDLPRSLTSTPRPFDKHALYLHLRRCWGWRMAGGSWLGTHVAQPCCIWAGVSCSCVISGAQTACTPARL